MSLGWKLSFEDLYSREGLTHLDRAFLEGLRQKEAFIYDHLLKARQDPTVLSLGDESSLLLKIAPHLEDFLAKAFGIEDLLPPLREKADAFKQLPSIKRPPYQRGSLNPALTSSHPRDGFECLTPAPSQEVALREANGCLICHKREKDSCARGFLEKGEGTQWRRNDQGVDLRGCPLGQKISEMHALRQQGRVLGALAMVMVDNPLVPLTGLRICTDCEDSCIFQKHQPIDTPMVETEILQRVLQFPWGVEIYSLLSRWNPLNLRCPLPKPLSGYRVLVVGLGPAGLALTHYLMQEGHVVWGIDGAKVEPLDPFFSRTLVADGRALWSSLEDRPSQGIGGVVDYGVTSRWDKNFLTLVRFALERRDQCLFQGGIRFGSSLTPQQAFESGVDHIALCVGAGRPHVPHFLKTLPQGVRMAADFLMALHVGGAFQKSSVAALQMRLPVVVIGGGLTALDAATEALAFYPRQLEKLQSIQAQVRPVFEPEDTPLLKEFLRHSQALRGLSPEKRLRHLQQWGGVTILYRKSLQEAPSFRLNPRELQETFNQGVFFREKAEVQEILSDEDGQVSGVLLKGGEIVEAKTVLIATGTLENTILFKEFPDLFEDPRVSLWGDPDPMYRGSVVKAIASAQKGHHRITAVLEKIPPRPQEMPSVFFETVHTFFEARVVGVKACASNLFEVTVRAPFMAQQEDKGRFFKLQVWGGASEGVALRTTHRDSHKGELTFQVKEVGASTYRLSLLRPGDGVFLMGPLGDPLPKAGSQYLVPLETPMQCMMKQLCAQCLQVVTDPLTGKSRIVFGCQELYHPEASVDTKAQQLRLKQNRLMERALWAWAKDLFGKR